MGPDMGLVVTAVVSLLVGISFRCSVAQTSFIADNNIEFESNFECVWQWQRIQINWTNVANSAANFSAFGNTSSFWEHFNDMVKRRTADTLFLAAKYPVNYTNSYWCRGNITARISMENSTVTRNNTFAFPVETVQVGTQLIGVKFVVISRHRYRRVKFYLRPAYRALGNITYKLFYCKVDELGFAEETELYFTCPQFTAANFTCSENLRSVYGVANSEGFVCVGSNAEFTEVFARFKFYIAVSGEKFSSKSHVFSVATKAYRSAVTLPLRKRGEFQAVLIGLKPRFLFAEPREIASRKIDVRWEATGAGSYKLMYNCSNGVTEVDKSLTQSSKLVHNEELQAYSLCHFCVQGLPERGASYSEPICNTTRLPEDAPSQPPTITCDVDSCPFKSDGKTRNVTITCNFPPEKTRNGVLTGLKVTYWDEEDPAGTYQNHSQHDLSSCKINLIALRNDRSYGVQVSACNSEGCSDHGNRTVISALLDSLPDNKSSSSFSLWWISLFIIPVLVCLALLMYYRRRKKQSELPSISGPDESYEEVCSKNSSENVEMYDKLSTNGSANSNDVNQIT